MNELIKAVQSLINDIEAMQNPSKQGQYWFGPFSESNESGVDIEWPNLAISLDNVKLELKAYQTTQAYRADMRKLELKQQADEVVLRCNGLPVEEQAELMSEAVTANPDLRSTKAFGDWCVANIQYLTENAGRKERTIR